MENAPTADDREATASATWRATAARAMVDSSPDGMILADQDGEILIVNRQIELLFGHRGADLIGSKVEVLLPEDRRSVHVGHRNNYRVEPRPRAMGTGLKLSARRADGTEFPVEVSLSPVEVDGALLVVATVRDIADRLEAERISLDQQAHLRVLEDRERLAHDLHDVIIQQIFAAGMSIQALQSRIDDPGLAERLDETVTQLDHTITELRSRIFYLNSASPTLKRTQLENVVDYAATTLGHTPELLIQGDPEKIPAEVHRQLLPALTEALSNVARHAQAGITRVEITIGDSLEVLVIDDGIGIGPNLVYGNGLPNLQARARQVGGMTSIKDGDDGGTVLTWTASLPSK